MRGSTAYRSLLPAFSRENCEMESNIMLEAKHKVNLSEKAYDEIKDAIYKGKVMPGDILSESQLASQLGMSRTPVREALRMLATENFVEVKNGIGAYVKPLSSKDMEDLYEVRCLLEVQAIKTSIYRITNDEIDAFERHFQALLDACERGEHPGQGEFSELDWSLHILFVERCSNKYIKSIVASYDSNLRRYQSMSIDALNDVRESARQHLEILKALRLRDADKASEVLKKHLEWSTDLLRIST